MIRNILNTIFLLSAITVNASETQKITGYSPQKVAAHTYVIHGPTEHPNEKNKGFMNNPGFVITSAGIVVIDPGSSKYSGEMVVEEISKISKQPIVAVFNSHIHGDHWLGNHGITTSYPDVKIYAHEQTLVQIDEGEGKAWIEQLLTLTNKATAGTKIVPPTISIKDGEELTFGDITFRVHHKGQAHTVTDVMIEVVEDKILFLGDNGVNQRIVRMDHASFKGSIHTLQHAIDLNLDVYVPGHGPTGHVDIVKQHQNYLSIIFEQVKSMYEEGLSDFEMRDKIHPLLTTFHQWSGYQQQFGKHVSLAYLEAENDAF